jgi:hypothetical protein
MSTTGYPFDGYDGTDESFEKLQDQQATKIPAGAYQVCVNGFAWEDADGNDIFTLSDASGLIGVLEAQGYDDIKLVRL